MDPTAILYPGVAMFFLTFAIVAHMGVSRLLAVRRRQVSVRYYRLYDEGEQPPRLQLLTRHAQNHFEVPPLVYLILLFIYVTGHVTSLTVGLAWLYFASRCVHSYIHLGTNKSRLRSAGIAADAGRAAPIRDPRVRVSRGAMPASVRR